MIFCCVFFGFSSDLQFVNLILVLTGLSRIPCFISIVKATIYIDYRVFHFSLDICHRPPRYVAVKWWVAKGAFRGGERTVAWGYFMRM
jgi:hypothetical protein